MSDTVHLALDEVHALALRVLRHQRIIEAQAQAMARVMTAGERDHCHSHGLFRLLMCAKSLREGKVVRDALPLVQHRSSAIVAVDAQHNFSPLAFDLGSLLLIEKTRSTGLGALVINNCLHFSALWPEVERLTDAGLCALIMTPSHACVAPAGGTLAVFGTNPIAFGWPRAQGHPYVFDFATSAIARGEIDLYRRSGRTLPEGWGIDEHGAPCTDAATVLQRGAMLTFGGYKGSALATMIELMAGPLLGDLTSAESVALDGQPGGAPRHGELILAFDPRFFSGRDPATDQASAEALLQAISGQGARLPSERRYAARARSMAHGVDIAAALHRDILAWLD